MSITKVKDFHQKFGQPAGMTDQLSGSKEVQKFRLDLLQEELTELRDALDAGDRVAAFDALLDLAYVTYGTALYMGIMPPQWESGMIKVHMCNMAKVRVEGIEKIQKPEGWTGPEARLKEILKW